MMALHKPVSSSGIYFITFTCHKWLPLIEEVKGYDLIYKWFDILSNQGHAVVGYVIMPNHLHLLIHYQYDKQSLNTIIGNGKRFLAYQYVDRLEKQGRHELLAKLRFAVKQKDSDRGKKHEIWKRSFDVKHCRTENFTFQKLQYIHNNPCAGKWRLVKSIIDYPYSSALQYICGDKSNYAVKDYRGFLEVEDQYPFD